MMFKFAADPLAYVLFAVAFLALVVSLYVLFKNRHSHLRTRWIIRTVVCLLILVVVVRPALPGGGATAGMSDIDVVFVVDTTSSIAGEDYDGSRPRLDGVKQDLSAIVDSMAGARFALLPFNSSSHLDAPLTTDTTALKTAIDTLHPEIAFYSVGSSISQPLDTLQVLLERMRARSPERSVFLYYLGDGEQTSDSGVQSFEPLKKYITGGAVFGYGTSQGGRMQSYGDGYLKSDTYVQDMSEFPYKDAISRIDEDNLQTIASQLGIQYSHRTKPSEIESVVRNAGVLKIADKPDIRTYGDMYWLFAAAIVLLLALDMYLIRTTLKDVMPKRLKS